MFISAFTKKLETVPCEHVSIFGYQLVGIPIYSHIFILLNFSMLNNLMWVSK